MVSSPPFKHWQRWALPHFLSWLSYVDSFWFFLSSKPRSLSHANFWLINYWIIPKVFYWVLVHNLEFCYPITQCHFLAPVFCVCAIDKLRINSKLCIFLFSKIINEIIGLGVPPSKTWDEISIIQKSKKF